MNEEELEQHALSVIELSDRLIAGIEKDAYEAGFDAAQMRLSNGMYSLAPLLEAKASAVHALALLEASKSRVKIRNYPSRGGFE